MSKPLVYYFDRQATPFVLFTEKRKKVHISHTLFQTVGMKSMNNTTETGRVFFQRRAKQLPLATNENVLGHVA